MVKEKQTSEQISKGTKQTRCPLRSPGLGTCENGLSVCTMVCRQSPRTGTGRPEPSGNMAKGELVEPSYGGFSGTWQSVQVRTLRSHRKSDESFQEMEGSLVLLEYVGGKCQEMTLEK